MAEMRVLTAEPISPNATEVLREALKQAEAGKLSSVAVATVFRTGEIGCHWSRPPSTALLIGAATRLQHSLCHYLDD